MSNHCFESSCFMTVFVGVACGCSSDVSTSESTVSNAAPIIQGAAVTTDRLGLPQILNDSTSSVCSSTQIADKWILTAAHCLTNDLSTPGTAAKLPPMNYLRIKEPNTGVAGWNSGDSSWRIYFHPTLDIALMNISVSFKDSHGVPWSNPLDGHTPSSFVGFGLTCYGWGHYSYNTSTDDKQPTLRQATLTPAGLSSTDCPSTIQDCMLYFKDDSATTKATAAGDSGGPCFEPCGDPAGTKCLVSVSHAQDTFSPDGRYKCTVSPGPGCRTYETAVYNFRDWVSAVMGAAGTIKFSSAGPISDMVCVQINEPSDPDTWNDNWLCSKYDQGFVWKYDGPSSDPNLSCVNVTEPSEPASNTWSDNYLCRPRNARAMTWSYAGPIGGKTCVQFLELADPYTWSDNYLCY